MVKNKSNKRGEKGDWDMKMNNKELEKKLKELSNRGLLFIEVDGKRIYTSEYYSNISLHKLG